jgi:hypothetical protein
VIVTLRVAVALVLLTPSTAVKLIVRVALFGVTAVSVYVIDRSALCHCASVAVAPVEVSVNTPVAALYDAAMLPIVAPSFVNASTSSPLWKPPVIATVVEPSVVALPSVTVKPESIVTGVDAVLSPATNEAEPESVVIVGGAVMLTVSVPAVLVFVPSLVANEIVRLPYVVLVLENVTDFSASAHCASDAVEPAEVSVNTPVAALYDAEMLPIVAPSLVKLSVSPLWKPPETDTVPDDCVVLSRSLTVIPPSIVVAEVPPA